MALLLDHIGADRAVVGGVSSGSGAALRFALRYPERIAGLIVVTPVYGGDEFGLSVEQAAVFKRMDEVGSRAVAEGVQVLRPLYGDLPPQIREKAWAMIDSFDAASVAATTRFIASGIQPFASASDLRRLTAPTLLVPGNDALHPAEVSKLYAANIPKCTVSSNTDGASALGEFCERSAAW